jgi:uncharacterized membrane protein YdjX (TVP38/TMEM64 family)
MSRRCPGVPAGDRAAAGADGGASYAVVVAGTRAARLRLAGLVLAVALGSALAWLVLGGDLDTVRTTVESAGPWAPLSYVVVHVVLSLVPVPKNLLAGIAGVLFGLPLGILLSFVGSLAAASVTFALARRIGRDAVASLTGPRVQRVEDMLREQGLVAVLLARLSPVPFTIVNYGAGVSPITWRDYLVGTAVGVVPGTVGYVALGASAGQDASTIVLAGTLAVLLFVATVLLGRRTARRRSRR